LQQGLFLETIPIIASIVSAVAAFSTTLRALGKSREFSMLSKRTKFRMLFLYLVVAVIWYALSIIFIAPLCMKRWVNGQYMGLLPWVLVFLFLLIVLFLFWYRIFSSGE
jgi:hypothetical protein